MILLLVEAGCSAAGEPSTRQQVPEPAPQDAGAEDRAAPVETPGIALRTALVPDTAPQPVRIRLRERRETAGEGAGEFAHELHLDLTATLTRTGVEPSGEIRAKLVLKHVKLEFGMPDRAETMLTYDSATDEPNKGNPLADIMTHVSDAELSLRIGPSGRLRDLHGLDPRWRKAGLIMAPPGLLAAQWLFRDLSMRELVAEALFPPMPAGPVRVGDAWEIDVPADIPLVARLNARVRHTLTATATDLDGAEGPVARIKGTGRIEPAPEILEGAAPAIQPIVKTGSVRITQTVRPGSQGLAQRSERTVEVLLTLTPPAGNDRSRMTIKQTRELISRRGRVVGPSLAQ